jgi:hypothetical protein
MLRNWALLPLIGYSPSQLLTLAVCRLRVCAMSLRTFGKSSRFLLSIIVINFFDPLLASIPTTRVHSCFSSQNSSFNVYSVLSVAAECNFVGPPFAPLGRAVEESLMACSPQNRHGENPPRIKIHRQRNPTPSNTLVVEELEPEPGRSGALLTLLT